MHSILPGICISRDHSDGIHKQVTFTILAVCALITAMHGNGQHLLSLKSVDIPIAMQVYFLSPLLRFVN
jgi:hypothetical protein